MNSREVKRTLRSMPARTRQEPMEKTIAALHTYFQKTPPTHRISFMGTAVRFVRFTAWKIWLFQGLVMVFISQFLLGFQDRQMAWTMGTSVKILCLFCGTIPLYYSLSYTDPCVIRCRRLRWRRTFPMQSRCWSNYVWLRREMCVCWPGEL